MKERIARFHKQLNCVGVGYEETRGLFFKKKFCTLGLDRLRENGKIAYGDTDQLRGCLL